MPPHFGQPPEVIPYIALNARFAVMRCPHSAHSQSRGAFVFGAVVLVVASLMKVTLSDA